MRPRTSADVASLLAELGRAVKARLFLPGGDRRAVEAAWRAWRALQGEVQRNGPLELEIGSGGFRCAGSPLPGAHLDGLARRLAERRLSRLRFDPAIDEEAFTVLLQVLAAEPHALAQGGGMELVLAPCAGIDAEGSAEEPVATGDAPEPALAADAGAEAQRPGSDSAARFAEEPDAFGALLQELDACDESATYDRLADQIASSAMSLAREGRLEETYRAIATFYAWCADEHKRTVHQRETARRTLARMLDGPALEEVVHRAGDPDPEIGVQAAQILLFSGEAVVAPLLRAIAREADPRRRTQLSNVLVTMGDRATRPLLELVELGDPASRRTAIRMCGEIQDPVAVECLAQVLGRGDTGPSREAAAALARIGGPEATDALLSALDSPSEAVACLAAQALGGVRDGRTVPALVRALRRSVGSRRTPLARELMRALGKIGQPEAAPALADLLAQRSLFRRARLRELKLAAVAALGRLPGPVAQRALGEAAQRGDARLRQAAREALGRRRSAS